METVSVGYRLVPLVTGAVLLPKMTVVPAREQVSRGGGDTHVMHTRNPMTGGRVY